MIISKSSFVENAQYYLDMLKETEAKRIIIADESDAKLAYNLSVVKESDSTQDEIDSIDDDELYNKILKTFDEEKTREIYDQVDLLYNQCTDRQY